MAGGNPREKEGGARRMKRLVVGLLAHVDAGKTTLSEAMLYRGGILKKPGRVDHGDSFLDTDALEKERGITIFSKQAVLTSENMELILMDTPGHVDFSSEMERTLQVLDYAVLVISGADGIQSHTRTLWRLLARHRIPTFLFVNKMDLPGADRFALLERLKGLDGGCVEFGGDQKAFLENVALCDETLLARYLERGTVTDEEIASLIGRRRIFPCYFGSALRMEGLDEFLQGLERYTRSPEYPAEFGAKVYKITYDPQGNRLTYLKITGGTLKVKALLTNRRPGLTEEAIWEEKADQLRVYSGAKYQAVAEAPAGTVCAVTGLSRTASGDGLGAEAASEAPLLEPVLTYRVLLPEGSDAHDALLKLSRLEEEDPQLHIVWNERLREIHLQSMGGVQMEVLRQLIQKRFGLSVEFGAGSILYRETIAEPVEGVGHFEPLRHYAEVHLLLEPGERGSGLRFESKCSEDVLDRSWQRLILTHLQERTHPGVLTGSPVTDLKITLVAGRASVKHTEGGDFRQATYRAVRQGLMCAKSVLLEPWYDFRLEIPADSVGRAMADLLRMSGNVSQPETVGAETVLTGCAPVSEMQDYAREAASYTRGSGRLSCSLRGYELCHNSEEVVAAIGYDSERDTENPADSVFCSHGAGFVVRWDQVREYMHVESGLSLDEEEQSSKKPKEPEHRAAVGSPEQDRELEAIFERTYGPVRTKLPSGKPVRPAEPGAEQAELSVPLPGPEYLLVDGYNIIFAWDELKQAAEESLSTARKLLMDLLSNYQGFRKCTVILVFDAYRVPHNSGEVIRYHNIHVVFTKEAETADAYIEKTTREIGKKYRVTVATSDNAEQLIILGHGALRLSARAFHEQVEQAEGEISAFLDSHRSSARLSERSFNAVRVKDPKDGG
jgi:small GTP-binding protein